MKPSRCRVMCPDCGKQKMQFETESEAKRFIQYNGEDISDAPEKLRVYYCPSCCCYHITSKKENKWFNGNTDRLIDAYYAQTGSTVEKVKAIRNIRDIVILEPSIIISKTGKKEIVKFELNNESVYGLDINNSKHNLTNFSDKELTRMLEKLCKKHYKL